MEEARNIAQLLTPVLIMLSFLLAYREYRKSIWVRKQDLYIRLELAAIDLFKSEIERPELERIYSERIHEDLPNFEDFGSLSKENKAVYDHVACLLNLFEIHYNLRRSKDIQPEIFASWLPWIYGVYTTPYFRWAWGDLQKHYVPDFRSFVNSLISSADDVTSEEVKQKAFYETASKLMKDKIIKNWLGDLKGTG